MSSVQKDLKWKTPSSNRGLNLVTGSSLWASDYIQEADHLSLVTSPITNWLLFASRVFGLTNFKSSFVIS